MSDKTKATNTFQNELRKQIEIMSSLRTLDTEKQDRYINNKKFKTSKMFNYDEIIANKTVKGKTKRINLDPNIKLYLYNIVIEFGKELKTISVDEVCDMEEAINNKLEELKNNKKNTNEHRHICNIINNYIQNSTLFPLLIALKPQQKYFGNKLTENSGNLIHDKVFTVFRESLDFLFIPNENEDGPECDNEQEKYNEVWLDYVVEQISLLFIVISYHIGNASYHCSKISPATFRMKFEQILEEHKFVNFDIVDNLCPLPEPKSRSNNNNVKAKTKPKKEVVALF